MGRVAVLLVAVAALVVPIVAGPSQAALPLAAPGPVGDDFPISPGEDSEFDLRIAGKPPIATDGTNFVVVWRRADSDVYAARVTPDGVVLDDPPLAIATDAATSGSPAVAFDGTNFLVVWSELPSEGGTWELRGRRIAQTGAFVDATPLALTTTADFKPDRQIGIVYGDEHYVVVYRTDGDSIRALRITPEGVNLDGIGAFLGHGFYPAVAFDGSRYLVVWHDEAPTHLDVVGRFLATDGTTDGDEFTISDDDLGQEHATVAFNGEVYLVAWYDWRPDGLEREGSAYFARVATDGIVLDDPSLRLAPRNRGERPVQVSTDGTDFLVVWGDLKTEAGDFRHIDVSARRITSGGTFLDEQPLGVATGGWHEWDPAVANIGARYLVVWGGLGKWGALPDQWGIHGQIVDTSLDAPPDPVGAPGLGGGGWVDHGTVPSQFVTTFAAFAPDNVYAFGEGETAPGGGIFHYDGDAWRNVDTPLVGVPPNPPQPNINRKWAVAPYAENDIWALGACAGGLRKIGVAVDAWEWIDCIQFSHALGAWADGRSVWTVNSYGELFRSTPVGTGGCESVRWCWQQEPTGTEVDLSDVWGIRADGLIAVGEHGTILRRDGPAWYVEHNDPAPWIPDPDVPTSQRLNAIDGSSTDDVWVVGDAGTILHWDGAMWVRHESGTLADLLDVWVARPDDVWAVGMDGTILHHDGAGWWSEESGTTAHVTAVGGVIDTATWDEHIWVATTAGQTLGTGEHAAIRSKVVATVDVPLARKDAYTTDEDVALTVATPGVLTNDDDPEAQPLTPVLDQGPEGGALDLSANGAFTYTPDGEFSGTDWFTYHVSDGINDSATVHVRMTVDPIDDPPIAEDDDYFLPNLGPTLTVDQPSAGVLANDHDIDSAAPHAATLVTGPQHGTLTLFADGAFTYTRDADFRGGTDTFTYRASSGAAQSAPATVTIEVQPLPANRAPSTSHDIVTTGTGQTIDIPVIVNDSDPDGDALVAEVDNEPFHGTVMRVNGGTVLRYRPDPGFSGLDSVTYRARDPGGLASEPAAVHIAVGEHTAAGDLAAGGRLAAGGGETPMAPLRVEVTAGASGPTTLAVYPASQGPRPGWIMLGWQAALGLAPATIDAPAQVTFRLHGSLLPPSLDVGDVTLFRDGVEVPPCDGSGARPDPCVAGRTSPAEGSATMTVRTSKGSGWTLGTAPTGRLAGLTRISTAVEVSRAVFASADVAVLARSDQFADALAGAPLAANLGAPLLLTERTALNPAVAEELRRLGVGSVVLLGGPSALAESVAAGVRLLGIEADDRVAGTDRYDTAARIARRIGGTTVYLALGNHAIETRAWPDALAAGALAAYERRPLLLVTTDRVPPATSQALVDLGVRSGTIVGGEAAVSSTVVAQLSSRGIGTDRLAGATRYDTSAAVADRMVAAGMNPVRVWFGSGANWPDALAAGPAAGQLGAPVLLVHPQDLFASAAVGSWLHRSSQVVDGLVVLGGEAAISADVEARLRAIARG